MAVLLQLESASRRSCQVIAGLPIDESVRLLVTAHPAAARATTDDAESLHDALKSQLVALGGRVSVPACGGTYHGTGHCMADDHRGPRDHICRGRQPGLRSSGGRYIPQFPSHVLMPVTENGRRATPSSTLRRNIMLRYPPCGIATIVPDVLQQARIGTDAFRVFISYRHDDCAAVASQIFHRLAEGRFAVFLDRFVERPDKTSSGAL